MIYNLGWPNRARNLQAWFGNILTSGDLRLMTDERLPASPSLSLGLDLHWPIVMKCLVITFTTSPFLWGHLFLNLLHLTCNSKKSFYLKGSFLSLLLFGDKKKKTDFQLLFGRKGKFYVGIKASFFLSFSLSKY
jgi:hypothetical protein